MRIFQKTKEVLKYTSRKYLGYDYGLHKIKIGQDFLDQKKILAGKEVKIIFDVGANVGQTTRKYRKLFPGAKIYGFDAYKEVFETYVRNFRGDKKIHGRNLTLSDQNTKTKFYINNNSYTNSLFPINAKEIELMANFKTTKEIQVDTETIDLFCEKNHIGHIDILKLDVQGGELLVLKGAKEMLLKGAVDLIYTEVEFVNLYENQPLFEDLRQFLEQSGYKFYKNYNLERDKNNNLVAGDAIFLHHSLYYNSQYGQDRFLDEKIFKKMTGGVFLEIGADDGIKHSNTLFFEKERNWTGLCVEPRTTAYKELAKNRGCHTANAAISENYRSKQLFLEIPGEAGQLSGLVDTFDTRHTERIKKETAEKNVSATIIEVPSTTLDDLLEKYNMTRIDYLSLDTEGGELNILKSIDYKRFPITCISVENNYGDENISAFLKTKGYRKVTKLKIDEIFILHTSPFNTYTEPLSKKIDLFYKTLKHRIKNLIGYNVHS